MQNPRRDAGPSPYNAVITDVVAQVVAQLRPALRDDVAALIAEQHGPLCLSVRDTAKFLGIGETLVRQLAYARRLPVQTGIPGERLLIDYPTLRRHLAEHVEFRGDEQTWNSTVAQIAAARGR